jgi:hypothetical protein
MTAIEDWADRNITTGTLADLDYKLEVQCQSCRRTTVIEPWELRRMFPAPVHLLEAGRRLRCQGCGARNPKWWIWVMGWTRDK